MVCLRNLFLASTKAPGGPVFFSAALCAALACTTGDLAAVLAICVGGRVAKRNVIYKRGNQPAELVPYFGEFCGFPDLVVATGNLAD